MLFLPQKIRTFKEKKGDFLAISKGPSPFNSEFGCETIVLCSYPNVRKSHPNVRTEFDAFGCFVFHPNVRKRTKAPD